MDALVYELNLIRELLTVMSGAVAFGAASLGFIAVRLWYDWLKHA